MSKTPPPAAPPRPPQEAAWLDAWERHVRTGEQALATVGVEPAAILQLLHAGAARLDCPLFYWDCARGFVCNRFGEFALRDELRRLGERPSDANPHGLDDPGLLRPLSALRAIPRLNVGKLSGGATQDAVVVLANFYCYFEVDNVRQEFENLVKWNELSSRDRFARPVHFLQAPYAKLGLRGIEAVKHWIVPLPYDLPTAEEIRRDAVAELVAVARLDEGQNPALAGRNDYSEDYLRGLAAAPVGLPRHRVNSVLFYVTNKHGGLTAAVPAEVSRLAAAELATTKTMEIVPDDEVVPPEQLGGVGRLMQAFDDAALDYTAEAQSQYPDPPLGVWLCGLEGAGKSTCAATCSVIFQRRTMRPWRVIKVRSGAFYGGLVGDTENNFYEFESRIKVFGECIVIFDEFGTMFSGVDDRKGDSGVGQSLFGLWLNWMSNPARRCYVVVTMNDPSGIPPQALREERFDAGFFFDMPTADSRAEILKIHFAKRLARMGLGLDDLGYDTAAWSLLGEATEHYKPSGLVGLVKQARRLAYRNRRIMVPTFDETMGLVQARQALVAGSEESAEAQRQMLDKAVQLRKKCRAMGAEPVHAPPPAPPAGNGAAPGGKPRRSLGLSRDN